MKTIYRTKDGAEFTTSAGASQYESQLFWDWLRSQPLLGKVANDLPTWNRDEERAGSDRVVFLEILKEWYLSQPQETVT